MYFSRSAWPKMSSADISALYREFTEALTVAPMFTPLKGSAEILQ
jgi:hypothetical protein